MEILSAQFQNEQMHSIKKDIRVGRREGGRGEHKSARMEVFFHLVNLQVIDLEIGLIVYEWFCGQRIWMGGVDEVCELHR